MDNGQRGLLGASMRTTFMLKYIDNCRNWASCNIFGLLVNEEESIVWENTTRFVEKLEWNIMITPHSIPFKHVSVSFLY